MSRIRPLLTSLGGILKARMLEVPVRLIRNPVAQFLAAGALVVTVIIIATGRLSEQAANDEAVADSLATTQVLARSVAEPAIPRGLVSGDTGAIDRFDRAALERLRVDKVKRIKIWNSEGQIVYSDQTDLIGQRFDLGDDELTVLKHGDSNAAVSDLSRPENRFEIGPDGLLEVYTRVWSPEGEPLLFEVYYSADDVAARKKEIFDAFRPITLGGLVLLLAMTTPLLWVLTRRLAASGRDRERLLHAAVEASAAERRRIARDLHDGVVQDLAGTTFALSAAARTLDVGPDETRKLDEMSGSLRSSMRSLRSLLVEIYPPDLHSHGLTAALDDLVAPAAGDGVQATVEVTHVEDVEDDVVALIWRVAQEAVRNALRHGHPTVLDVFVSGNTDSVVLEVIDNGRGFEPTENATGAHFGLRGLRDLIKEIGGTLDVRSAPGEGTAVRLEVSLP